MGTAWFPKVNERFFCKIKENNDFRGGVLWYAAQGNPQADAEIANRRFWTGTSSFSPSAGQTRSLEAPARGLIPATFGPFRHTGFHIISWWPPTAQYALTHGFGPLGSARGINATDMQNWFLTVLRTWQIRRRLRQLQDQYYRAAGKNDALILEYFRVLESARNLSPGHQNAHGLHLGCEDHHIQGWINVDIVRTAAVDVQADLSKPLPFRDGSIDFVHSEDLLEHLEPDVGRNLLAECFRVLRPGGIMRVLTPDLTRLVRNVYLHPRTRHLKWCAAYLDAPTPCEALNAHCRMGGEHRFIYDFPFLKSVLTGIGFHVRRVSWNRSHSPSLRYLDLRGFGLNLFLEAAKPITEDRQHNQKRR